MKLIQETIMWKFILGIRSKKEKNIYKNVNNSFNGDNL